MSKTGSPPGISRRRTVGALAGAGLSLPIILSPVRGNSQARTEITLAIWGDKGSVTAYENVIAKYKTVRPDVAVKFEVTPFGQYYQQIDTRLAGRQAPDLFRVEFQVVGRYARSRALMDLTPHLPADFGSAFPAAFWQAVNLDGRTFAIPQNTDTLAVFYNVDIFNRLGIRIPAGLAESWSWAEFMDIARLLRARGGVRYSFAMLWQNSQAYRWLPFLYQHGGQLLSNDLKTPEIESAKGIETIAWTQNWFKEGLVPPNTAVKSNEQPQALFANGTLGMYIGGDWQMPYLDQNSPDVRWNATYMPRDVAMASDLGGSCTAVWRETRNPEAVMDFLKFLTSETVQRDFTLDGQFLPVRSALIDGKLAYASRRDARKVFLEQATTVPPHLVQTVVLPSFSRINQRLADQLDLAFTSGQSAELTAKNIGATISTILRT